MTEQGFLSRRVLDALFLAQVVLTVVVLSVVFVYTIQTGREVQQISERQIDYVELQNNAQICNQHDMLVALITIGDKLGLPTDDIVVPDVEGLDCP
jgi:hypothetical protein